MTRRILSIAVATLLTACQSTAPIQEEVSETSPVQEEQEYPQVEFAKLNVVQGSQTLTAANKLADELGIEFVEWAKELNPYDYYQLRSKRITLDFDNPQSAYLELFDRSGLLPIYQASTNTVTIYPFSLNERVSAPHIFTPQFARSQAQQKQLQKQYETDLARNNKVLEYHYYQGFTVKDTIDAWAEHANLNGVIWFLDDPVYSRFLNAKLQKSDFNVGSTPMEVMTKFIEDEKRRQSQSGLNVSLVVEQSSNKLIVHPYSRKEIVKSFEIQPGSVRHNLSRIADFYDYTLKYRGANFEVPTGYTTVLTSFVRNSVQAVVNQYPISIEVVDSTKEIIARGN